MASWAIALGHLLEREHSDYRRHQLPRAWETHPEKSEYVAVALPNEEDRGNEDTQNLPQNRGPPDQPDIVLRNSPAGKQHHDASRDKLIQKEHGHQREDGECDG
jgi:hypothetical protein